MKNQIKILLFVLSLCIAGIANATTYYVSPTGSDSNPGTISAPFATFNKLSSVLVAGDIAYIRGGTYQSPAGNGAGTHFLVQNLTGTSSNPIKIWAYPGEKPILSCSNITPTNENPFIFALSNCKYVHIKGIKMTMLKQVSSGNGISRGFNLTSSNYCTIEQIETCNISGVGFVVDKSNNNLILNCDSHHNGDGLGNDPSYGTWNTGDGFEDTGGDNSTDNTYDGCRAWLNSDDGFDWFAWSGNKVTIKNCWSFWNGIKPWGTSNTQPNESQMTPEDPSVFFNKSGYVVAFDAGEGFKLGGFNVGGPGPAGMPTTLKKYLDHCLSFENTGTGFTANMAAQYSHKMQLVNCTSYGNGNDGFGFGTGRSTGIAQIFKNDWSYNNNRIQAGGDWVYDGLPDNISNNYWNSTYQGVNYGNLKPAVTITAADFLSTSSAGSAGARQSDGSLPSLNFLKLATGSDLINAGINIGLPFLSTAPDLGYSESGGTTSNIAPTANAGADQTITLPTSSVSFNGSGTDPDGTIASYAWTKISGPTSGTISTPAAASTTVTGMIAGAYQFQLTVTDNKGATATDVVQVNVNNVVVTNTPPVANAGSDTAIVMPASSVTLKGKGTDANGTISAYAWMKVSGPTGGTIATATAANTAVTALIQGTYKFELKVTDNGGAIGKDTVQVTVNAAGGVAPVSNAGRDSVITLPTNTVSLKGRGTDADGTIAAYAWSKVAGPTAGTISTPTTANTTVTALAQGVYKFELKVTDNSGLVGRDTVQITVNAAAGSANNAYGGVRWAIPGTIQAEDFDNGGNNVAYYDDGAGNNGGVYRTNESVDIQNSNDGSPNIGWINAGEWTKYSVNITTTGTYTIEARIASPAAGKSFRIEMNGTTIATVAMPNTAATNIWKTVTVTGVSLTAGANIMRLYSISGGYNINYVKFTLASGASTRGATDSTADATAQNAVTVFPVPLSSSYTVSLNDEATGVYNLALLDASGKTLWKKEVNKTSSASVTESIYIGHLPNGAYTLQVTDPAKQTTTQILLKN